MNITRIQAHQIETPRVNGIISGHVILFLHVDDGPIGLGEASDSIARDLDSVVSQYNKLLVGRDATRISEINEFLRTHDFKSTVSDNHLVSAIDLALYDLNGKALGVPAYRLMGGKFRDRIYCCYPTWGNQASVDYEATAGYLQRLVDHGHHLFRYYVSGEADFDNHFLTDMFSRFDVQPRAAVRSDGAVAVHRITGERAHSRRGFVSHCTRRPGTGSGAR
jgi:L-alanine-DL-glutamate epimerase-like enolase superfamily enzyme